ncbi:MAG: hypothetical protein AMXMBFR84_00840 [Candidatus Hydrogenedentota bacterium]
MRNRSPYSIASSLAVWAFTVLGFAMSAMAAPLFEASVHLDLGRDCGQRIGTLFEVVDANGHVLFGAGASDIHSLYTRANNRTLDFYYKAEDFRSTIEVVGKPFGPDRNASCLILDSNKLLTYFRGGVPVQLKEVKEGGFEPYDGLTGMQAEKFNGLQFVDNRRIVFAGNNVWLGDEIAYQPERPALYYFVNGKLYVYLNDAPQKLWIYDWDPTSQTQVKGTPEQFDVAGTLFVFGAYNDEVFISSNIGNNYAYKSGELRTIRASDGTSWQGYAVSYWYDELWIGHYPSGSIYGYRGKDLALITPPVPRAPGAIDANREAQIFGFYGGDLYVGVWPWGELWRLDCNSRQWSLAGRVFHSPVIDGNDVPYRDAMQGKPGDYNLWGQRIMNLVGTSHGLYISTMNKRGDAWDPAVYDFLTPEVVSQYGAIHRLTGPAQASGQIVWKPSTTFRFVCDREGLFIYQDAALLAKHAIQIPEDFANRIPAAIRLGKGVYGPLTGRVINCTARVLEAPLKQE